VKKIKEVVASVKIKEQKPPVKTKKMTKGVLGWAVDFAKAVVSCGL
jgi:hypothetical protein